MKRTHAHANPGCATLTVAARRCQVCCCGTAVAREGRAGSPTLALRPCGSTTSLVTSAWASGGVPWWRCMSYATVMHTPVCYLVKVGFHSPNVLVVSIQCILARIASFHQCCLHVYKRVSDSAPCTLSSSHTFPLYVTSRSSVSGTPVGLRLLRASTRAMAAAAASLSRLPLLLLLPAWS